MGRLGSAVAIAARPYVCEGRRRCIEMRRRIPTISWLQAFEAAARHLSFTAAAAELFVTQSAVSQQTRHLEDYLGTSLFRRTPKGLELTEAGINYLPVVTEAFHILERGTLAYIEPETENDLKIEANLSFSVLWLVPRIHSFLSEYPNVKLRLSTILWSSEFRRIPAGIQIRFGRGNWAGLSGTKLTNEMIYPVCSPGLARRISETGGLIHERLLEVTGVVSGWQTWFTGARVDVNTQLKIHMTNTYIISMELARKGYGVALGHDTIAKDLIRRGELVVPLDIRIPIPENYYLVTADSRSLNRLTIRFCEWLSENID